MPSSVALVTGVAGQIGARLVQRFTETGYAVVGLDLVAGDGILGCDITDPEAVRATVDHVLAEHGRIDVLVHNAGISAIGRFEDHDVATHERVMAVEGVARGRDLVLAGRTARLSYHLSRLAPRLYVRLMTRRLGD